MRKKRFALLVAILAVTLLLTACAGVNLTLTFEVDGEAYATVTTAGQEAVQMPKDPTKEGYLFDGWYWDKDVWQKPFTANSLLETPLSENMTVYAKWKEVEEEHVHSFGEWTVVTAATCTAEGTEKRVCECGEAETRVIEKLPHSFGEWTEVTPSTCTAEGTEKRVCECGEAETRAIVKRAHTYETKCDATNHWKECSVCNDKKDKAAHTYENDVCTVCGSEYVTIGLEYKKVSGGYEVSGIGTAEGSNIVIPSTYEGEPVLGIGSSAFSYCRSLVSIVIPNSVTSIGSDAFSYCRSLVSVAIPSSVTSIGSSAFSGSSLKTITVAEGNTKYHSAGNCIIETQTKTLIAGCKNSIIPTDGSVTSIGSDAFRDCGSLVSIEIPSSVTSIGSYAFSNCRSLVSIEIPSGVTSIGSAAFSNCDSLTKVEISDIAAWCGIKFGSYNANPLYNAKHLYLNGEEVTELVIPEGVTRIGSYAFDNCSSLVNIIIPSSVTYIDSSAFYNCSSLTIYAEASAKPSGWDSGWNSSCPVLWDYKNNDVAHDGFIYTIQNGIRYGIKNGVATVVRQPSNITTANIPSEIVYKDKTYSVTSIDSDAFEDCSSLVSIVIPSSVTSIGTAAFSNCSSLVSIEIPNSVTSIGDVAFYNCRKLANIVYGGTKAEWKDKITKGSKWNDYTGNYTVKCTDGTLTKKESIL